MGYEINFISTKKTDCVIINTLILICVKLKIKLLACDFINMTSELLEYSCLIFS